MQNSWEHLFSCDKCGKPLTIKIIKGHGNLVTVGKCTNGHRKKFYLSLIKMDEWISLLNTHFLKCVKCDAPVNINPIYKGVWVKVQIKCPIHGRNENRLLPMTVYTAMMQAGKQSESISTTPSPKCHYCRGKTTFVPQYSRYYCYKCKRYVEDQKVVEKVRYTPEINDLRIRIKNFVEKTDKNISIAICDLPFEMHIPNTDSSKIEDLIQEMIIQGELKGELDSATGYVTFLEPSYVTKSVSIAAKDKIISTEVPTPLSTRKIEAVRDFDYIGGQVRFKIAIRNKTKYVVTNIGVELYIPQEFKLIRILPETSLDDLKRGFSKISELMPNSSQGIDYFLEPIACGTGVIAGIVKYLDAEGHFKSIELKPKEIAIKCPLVFTPEEANIAMVRNLTNNLTKDYRRWALPTSPQDSFTLLHETVNQFEITHIQAFQISGTPYEIESWYYTRTKNTNHPITLRINVSEQKNIIDLTIACEDMAELTGLLAKISENFQTKLLEKLQIDLKPAFGKLKELLCECGSPISKLPTISEKVVCNNCQKNYTWEMLN